MAIICSGISLTATLDKDEAIKKAKDLLNLSENDILMSSIHKMSIDARHKNNIKQVISVYFSLKDENKEKTLAEKFSCVSLKSDAFDPVFEKGEKKLETRPIVIGFGPAGMFSALLLAMNGYRPIIIERGQTVDEREKTLKLFWDKNKIIFNSESNVQFGEGGAGTFSDGKLTTRINDPACAFIIDCFVKFGAPSLISQKAKPHIGTDYLKKIVKNIRNEIIKLGGEFFFDTKVTDFIINENKLTALETTNGKFGCQVVILATGHSARDTFYRLYDKGILIEPKSFSVGVRIEHHQSDINNALYGDFAEKNGIYLPNAEYQYSFRDNSKENKAVYTFCMCPGGVVVPASSEKNSVVTNGMSEFKRNGENANSALVVSVNPDEYQDWQLSNTEPDDENSKLPDILKERNRKIEKNMPKELSGIFFQRKIERNAFEISEKSYKAPFQTVGDFMNNTHSKIGKVIPSYSSGVKQADIKELFPDEVNKMLNKGLRMFTSKMPCFSSPDSILTAPETRTSAPLRILRNDNLESVSCQGLYPCGEGAGYAGGIVSAAADGIKCARKIINNFKPFE